MWFALADRTLDFAAACAAAGVIVRPFPGDGVRCTIGERAADDRLLEVSSRFPH